MKTTSSAVNGVPSDHMTSLRVQVISVRSSEMPLPAVGMNSARAGSSTPSGPNRASGSSVRLAASASLVPPESKTFACDGACHCRSSNSPPWPAVDSAMASSSAGAASSSSASSSASLDAASVMSSASVAVSELSPSLPPHAAAKRAKTASSASSFKRFI